ncbi:UNVERIFIED_CONTAM: hypothetical protein FKN15_029833 [Acipenser sinensis]
MALAQAGWILGGAVHTVRLCLQYPCALHWFVLTLLLESEEDVFIGAHDINENMNVQIQRRQHLYAGACRLACKLPRAALSIENMRSADGTRFGGQRVFVFALPSQRGGGSGKTPQLNCHVDDDVIGSSVRGVRRAPCREKALEHRDNREKPSLWQRVQCQSLEQRWCGSPALVRVCRSEVRA